jgi:hypothetical protein
LERFGADIRQKNGTIVATCCLKIGGRPTMKACKVFPGESDMATLVCPYCGFYKDVNIATFKNHVNPRKVRCTCRSNFAVSFERRRAFRKETYLEGYCIKLPEDKVCSKIVINDISPTGIGFTMVTTYDFRKGDKVRLQFTLDDTKRSEVTKTATVRWVDKANRVGCEFCDPTQFDKGDKALGFYLMF